MKETKFYLITDTHYFAPKLGCSGPEYDDLCTMNRSALLKLQASTAV